MSATRWEDVLDDEDIAGITGRSQEQEIAAGQRWRALGSGMGRPAVTVDAIVHDERLAVLYCYDTDPRTTWRISEGLFRATFELEFAPAGEVLQDASTRRSDASAPIAAPAPVECICGLSTAHGKLFSAACWKCHGTGRERAGPALESSQNESHRRSSASDPDAAPAAIVLHLDDEGFAIRHEPSETFPRHLLGHTDRGAEILTLTPPCCRRIGSGWCHLETDHDGPCVALGADRERPAPDFGPGRRR